MSRYHRARTRAFYWRMAALAMFTLSLVHLGWTHQDKVDLDNVLLEWKAQRMRLTSWSTGGRNKQVALDSKDEHWCTPSEYLEGEWLLREEEVTLENIRAVFKYTDLGLLKCRAADEPRGVEPGPDDPAAWARILETAQYKWVPKSVCKQHSWSKWNFAKYCLRSKGGCSLVGDSLADQIYTAIWSSMITKGDSLFKLHASTERIFDITVNANHPMAQMLADAAGVTVERFNRPIFNFWREHHLVNREDLDAAFVGFEGYEKWVGGPSMAESGWIWDRSRWYELWNSLLAHAVELVPRSLDKRVPLEENSVISFSSGPHWTPVELWPKESAGKVTPEQILHGYTAAVDRVIQNVTAVAQDNKVLTWWRGSTAAHPQCSQYTKRDFGLLLAENNRTTHHSTLNPTVKGFNWDYFTVYDKLVVNKLEGEPEAAMRFMDLWPISVTRPDSHLKSTTDCLHFCSPGVPNELLEYLWHSMVLEGENDDYDDFP
ncbi:hypothetical protein QFC21_005026 [Naganishia friedmannii]|uniref:Uncharacterized protein n=1 Tax=Naganishia friedmannii TaxID=89922 RepID=A0ACC2VCG3_9TREE|nr:hypothetical protein QFC21_005026 [Naganishia friedmannii]